MSDLFDHHARQLRAARVKTSLTTADFLLRRAAEGLAERLDDVKRDFTRTAIVGAGGGVFAEAARERATVVLQTESAAPLADLARAAAPEVETRVADDEHPDLPTGQFDLLIGGMTLHRVNDPVGLLTQMRLTLKPDGLLLAALFGGVTLHELRASFAEAETAVEGGVSPRVAPMGEIRDLGALLQRAGFALPVADVDRFEVSYETPFHLMRDLRAMGEANMLTQRRRTFTRRETMLKMAEIYAAHFPAGNGRIRATFEIVCLTGWAPDASQPQPLRPGSATARLADALGAEERPLGEKPGPL